ncbi:MAG: DJ-1/PfpI family protein [Prevotellaceae bacterium]|jgi:4-methyl-5(b-hydroxyethyl)-thiazole monophosphate biosynthesis|nr:DJ-1/PfpI family protein [Prevotellaceae bacterium]
MAKIFIFLATGFEETEAIVPIDILRRAELEVETVSITSQKEVTGAHGITVVADSLFDAADFSAGEMLILPGGMPGARNLNEHAGLKKLIADYHADGKYISAICAAPMILGEMGLLKGEKAISYPGFEKHLLGATVTEKRVVVSNRFITAKGPGVAMEFALEIVKTLKGEPVAEKIALAFIFK